MSEEDPEPDVLERYHTEVVSLDSLSPHPRNYRRHPEDQLEHIRQSLREFGFYRNVVVAADDVILAGHGVCEALASMQAPLVEVYRLPVAHDHPKALKLLAADNELSRRAEVDDRMLTEILRDVRDEDESGLEGTGYDDQMLAGLLLVTRSRSEIEDFDAAKEWLGMPSYEPEGIVETSEVMLTLRFNTEADKKAFIDVNNLRIRGKSAWYPPREDHDTKNLKFEPQDEQ